MNPRRPHYITVESRDKMSRKEKDFIQLVGETKRSKRQIKRKLYITSDVGYWKLRKRVMVLINPVYCKPTQ